VEKIISKGQQARKYNIYMEIIIIIISRSELSRPKEEEQRAAERPMASC
jgi:hypothetical protein